MEKLDLELITPALPTGAYDLKLINNFVANWKKPNAHAATGFHAETRFFALPFMQALQAQLPELKSWAIVNYDNQPAELWADRAALVSGNLKLWASVQGYGANAYTKVNFQAYAIGADKRSSTQSVEISCSLSRPIAQIARDVAKRILPNLDSAKLAIEAKDKARQSAEKLITDKALSLQKHYPNLRILPDTEAQRIRIETKYGAGIHLDCYTYLSGDNWRLTSDRGTSLSLDKLDSVYGRAFLKLCNGN